MELLLIELLTKVATYGIVFTILLAIIVYLYIRQKKNEKKIDELQSEIRTVERDNLTIMNKTLAMFDKFSLKLDDIKNLIKNKHNDEK
jgi:uncharacterized protein YoxC